MEETKKILKPNLTDEEATKLTAAFASDPVAFMKTYSNLSITELFTNEKVIAKLNKNTLEKIIKGSYLTITLSRDDHSTEEIKSFNAHQEAAQWYYQQAVNIIIRNTQLLNRLPSESVKDICLYDQNYATEVMNIAETLYWTNKGYIAEIATKWPKLREAAAKIPEAVSVNTAKEWLSGSSNSPAASAILLTKYALDPAMLVDNWMFFLIK